MPGPDGEPVAVEIRDLAAEIERQARGKIDFVVDTRNLKMVLDGGPKLQFPGPEGDALRMGIRPWAHSQIAEKTQIPARYYERCRVEAADLLCENVNRWIVEKERRMLRTLDGHVRAVVSDRFRALDNFDLFFACAKVFDEVGAQIMRADLSDTRFYMRAVRPDIRAPLIDPRRHEFVNDEICSGVVVSNSEVGAGALKVEEYALRLKCVNGVIGEDIYERIHLGEKMKAGILSPETISATTHTIWLHVRDYIRHAFSIERLQGWAEMYNRTQKVLLPEPTKLTQGSWSGLDVSEYEKNRILKHLFEDNEGQTQFGLINAVTATARDLADAERRAALEHLGYRLLNEEEAAFQATMVEATVPMKR